MIHSSVPQLPASSYPYAMSAFHGTKKAAICEYAALGWEAASTRHPTGMGIVAAIINATLWSAGPIVDHSTDSWRRRMAKKLGETLVDGRLVRRTRLAAF